MAWIVTAIGGLFTAAGAATAVAAVLPTMAVTATALGATAATGLTLGGAALIGGTALTAASAMGAFDGGGGDGGGEGRYGGNDSGGGSQLTSQDLYDLGFEFDMPLDDAAVSAMTEEAGLSLGLENAGFSWKDGLGWIKTGLGLFNAAAGAYGQYRQGRNAAGNADAAARDSRLSAEDAKRRSEQLELWGMGQAKLMQPWDENGGRAMAGEQLKALLNDPAQVSANDPAYKLRMQAAARAMGIYGQDSGAMGVAAADASSSWYDQRLAQLSGLAGATAPPGAGGQLGYNTLTGAATIAGMGQASGAFGNQAAGAANDARNRSTVTTINAAGQLVDAAGRLLGGSSGSGGGDYRFTVGVNGSGSGNGSGGVSGGVTTGTPGATIGAGGKPGYDPSTGASGRADEGGFLDDRLPPGASKTYVQGSQGPYLDPEYISSPAPGANLPGAGRGFNDPNYPEYNPNLITYHRPDLLTEFGDRTATGYPPGALPPSGTLPGPGQWADDPNFPEALEPNGRGGYMPRLQMPGPFQLPAGWQPPGGGGPNGSPFLPGAAALGGSPFVGPLQQMQGLGGVDKSKLGPPQARTQWPYPDPEASMSGMGQPQLPGAQGVGGGPYPGPQQTAPLPNAQGNNLGPAGTIDPTIGTTSLGPGPGPGDQTQNMGGLDYFGIGGDLLGNYLKPRGLAQSRGG